MIPINVDGLVVMAYISMGSALLLLIVSQILLASSRFRSLAISHKMLSAVVLALLVTNSIPFFRNLVNQVLLFDALRARYASGSMQTDWYTGYQANEGLYFRAGDSLLLTGVRFLSEAEQDSLLIQKMTMLDGPKKRESLVLVRPQAIDGWHCIVSDNVQLDRYEQIPAKALRCQLTNAAVIEGIAIPKGMFVYYAEKNGQGYWQLHRGWDNEKVTVNGLQFSGITIELSLDRQQITSFHGYLEQAVRIDGVSYLIGSEIDKTIFEKYLDNRTRLGNPD